MKFHFFLFAGLLWVLSCKDDLPPVFQGEIPELGVDTVQTFLPCNRPESGTASGIKISATWNATAECSSYEYLGKKYWTIELLTCSEFDEFREDVFFQRIPDSHPKGFYAFTAHAYPLSEGYVKAGYARLASDGDVLDDYYYVDTLSANDYLIIDKWDTLHKQIEGRFRVSFNIRQPRNNPENPEKVKFWKGQFRLPLRE
ncbi:MAG TPA: hypothetical protein PLU53_15470 [Bacteroidia bacterium]|nr:hypothetical protein [Bacteroidia bacterium]